MENKKGTQLTQTELEVLGADMEAQPILEEVCRREGLRLVRTQITWETGRPEPLYVLSDGFGYTLQGLKNSLKDQEPK
ncbi:hypothetical protein J4457_00065 [Candidatus Woesearchaeota archaeon]|nr:hypothetical protein [Candidatus Woesearchaeota archaeon]